MPTSGIQFWQCEVKKFWDMMVEDGRTYPSKTQLCADAWGIRKLMSHALRNLRQDRNPRAPWLQYSTGFALIKGNIYICFVFQVLHVYTMLMLIGFHSATLIQVNRFFLAWLTCFHTFEFPFAPLSLERSNTSTWSSSEHGIPMLQSSLLKRV